jgi:excisionase family DNA binding protein
VSEEKFYKLGDVAQLLDVSKRTVEELVYSGELTSYRIRGTRRVSHSDLTVYLERARG